MIAIIVLDKLFNIKVMKTGSAVLTIILLISFLISFSQTKNPLIGGIWEVKKRHFAYYKAENKYEYNKSELEMYVGDQISFYKDSILCYTVELINFNKVKKYIIKNYHLEDNQPLNLDIILKSYGKNNEMISFIDKFDDKNNLYLIDKKILLYVQDQNIFVLERANLSGDAYWLRDSDGYYNIKSKGYKSFDFLLPKEYKAVDIHCILNESCKSYILLSTLNIVDKKVLLAKDTDMNSAKFSFKNTELKKKIGISISAEKECIGKIWLIKIKINP